ncbi:MAG: FAD-dependent oxidoreductase [Bacteroidetes bacterium]|nr:FAD-dependent oxidoreductase [Bacteroidota bacterium]MDA1121846.1 FAD-dependent oxidoreductase [Bacteroidota bacterium]
MKINRYCFLYLAIIVAVTMLSCSQKSITTDVLVIGGGTGGIAAGLQSARMGVGTIIVEEGPWLGGMLSSAGVSATDGNYKLPSGIWNEFREEIYKVYGGPDKVATGWISNTHFEPHVADSIFKQMVLKEANLYVLYHHRFLSVIQKDNTIIGARLLNLKTEKEITIYSQQLIEATELGDVVASANIPFSLGMESGEETGENVGVMATNDIIQDLTLVAILKDYGEGSDHTIPQPMNYTPEEFDGACTDYYNDKNVKAPNVDAQKMLDYAKLPNNKYMINWPIKCNDSYLNTVLLTPEQREVEIEKAKEQTLRFVYFIQTQLGYKHLGLADDEFGTKDNLALLPYHRESRRVKGLTRFIVNHIAKPFDYNYYRTGISVGDYPIDHHHKKNSAAPQHLEFYPIPSFNIPLGSLIPEKTNGLIICDKSISVSNVVNGTTRLQPVVLLTGQAAGTLAALCVSEKKQAREISVRSVQQELINSSALIMPYIDAGIDHPHFQSIQKIGATGILRGTGIPHQWANQTWFYPDSLVNATTLMNDLKSFGYSITLKDRDLTVQDGIELIATLDELTGRKMKIDLKSSWTEFGLSNFNSERNITRTELAVLLDKSIDPFQLKQPDHDGYFK